MKQLKNILFKRQFHIFKLQLSIWDIAVLFLFLYYIVTTTSNVVSQLLILLMAIILHEIAHGYAALYLGDPTAKNQNRLTLNPLHHIDPLGSVILPLILLLTGSPFFIGWAKPVPVNPRFFRDPLKGMMLVAIAGPATNITLMLLAISILKFIGTLTLSLTPFIVLVIQLCKDAIIINSVLAVFNLIPIPPLDGSKILLYVLPKPLRATYQSLEPYGMPIIFLCAIFGVFGRILNYTIPPLLALFF